MVDAEIVESTARELGHPPVVFVIPSLVHKRTVALVESMAPEISHATIVVRTATADAHPQIRGVCQYSASSDEFESNIGVAASWNIGALTARRSGGWLVMLSSAVTFGPAGGTDYLFHLAESDVTDAGICATNLGWHGNAIHSRHLATDGVGLFDEVFWPAELEETDWLFRAGLAGLPSPRENKRPWPYREIDADQGPHNHGEQEGGVHIDRRAIGDYYAAKWGGPQGSETFEVPFGMNPDRLPPDGWLGDLKHPWSWLPTDGRAAGLRREFKIGP